MNQEQVNQLVGMIQAIDGKIDAFKDEVRNRFDDLEQRMTNVEGAAARIAGPAFPGAPPRASSSGVPNSGYGDNPLPRREAYISHQPARGPPDQRGGWSSKSTGSKENATYLPYAIEHIAKKYQQRAAGDKRHCSHCGRETFSLSCFRLGHFRWCRLHQRPIIHPHTNCGRDYKDCQKVKWEVHPEWDTIVAMSYSAGLGKKGVEGLNELLFPCEDFPDKYDINGQFVG